MFLRFLTIAALALLFLTVQIGLGYVLGLALRASGAVDPLAILSGDALAILPMMAVAMLATVAAFCALLAVVDYRQAFWQFVTRTAHAVFVIGNPSLWPLFRSLRDPLAGVTFSPTVGREKGAGGADKLKGVGGADRLHRSTFHQQV